MILALSRQEHPRSVVVVLHVGNSSSKSDLPANLTLLDGIGPNVGRIGNDLSWVLFISEVLLDVCVVGFMLIGCTVISLLDSALRLEPFFITSSDLDFTILDPKDFPDSWLV